MHPKFTLQHILTRGWLCANQNSHGLLDQQVKYREKKVQIHKFQVEFLRLKDRLEMSWTRPKFVLEIFWIKFLIRMLLYGELISLGEGVLEQEEEFLYASKMTFTGSESWLGKTENKFLSLET